MSWTLIEHQALSSSVASVTLGSGGTIPQTYKTLKLVISARSDRTASAIDYVNIKPNNSTTNLTGRFLYGDGSTATSGSGTTMSASINTNLNTASTFSNTKFIFPNYTSTTANKPVLADSVVENNGTIGDEWLGASLWSNTSAITSIVVVPASGPNFVSGCTFTLYGLA